MISGAEKYGAAAPGIFIKDTVCVVDENDFFKETTERETLRGLQTPQVFSALLIKEAHKKAKEEKLEFTDDCSLYSYYGGKVYVSEGELNNIKITVPEDIPVAELIMEENGI